MNLKDKFIHWIDGYILMKPKKCPNCSNTKLYFTGKKTADYYEVRCEKCGWTGNFYEL